MNRRRDDLQNIDTSIWPIVDVNALPAASQKAFAARHLAIERHCQVPMISYRDEKPNPFVPRPSVSGGHH